jgi:hypothetical protein
MVNNGTTKRIEQLESFRENLGMRAVEETGM